MTVLDRSAIEAALRGPLGDTFNPDGPAYGTLLPRLTEALLKAQEEATQKAAPPVWPVTDEMRQVLYDWSNGKSFSTSKVCARIARLGFHAMVDGLPRENKWGDVDWVGIGHYSVQRSALHALDPEGKP